MSKLWNRISKGIYFKISSDRRLDSEDYTVPLHKEHHPVNGFI